MIKDNKMNYDNKYHRFLWLILTNFKPKNLLSINQINWKILISHPNSFNPLLKKKF